MSLYLVVVNFAALVGAAVALIRHVRSRVGRGDVGRALMVCLAALLTLAAVGLTRRAEIVLPDVVLAATWTSVSVAAWWTATRSKLTPPQQPQGAPMTEQPIDVVRQVGPVTPEQVAARICRP